MKFVNLAVEGDTDVPVAERLIGLVGLEPHAVVTGPGAPNLDPRIPEFNRSGEHLNWLILRDLDHDASCPAELVPNLLGGRPMAQRVVLRVPVRAVESWLMADREGFAREFSVRPEELPRDPDSLSDPKRQLIDICRRSRRADVRRGMVPREAGGRTVGPEYTIRIVAFARFVWSPQRAAEASESLRRSLAALRRRVDDGSWN
ncbi:MAG: hypothetical protein F4X59_04915 [Holophagales bacterium]|nr:hypothetical protein [Holophagales bacterium]MYC09455.1 hypothetical protein [Holophagales bacterium]